MRDWKRASAWLVFWAFFYSFTHPILDWLIQTIAIAFALNLPILKPLPEMVLMAGTLQLATIGGIQVAKDKFTPRDSS